MLLIKANLPHNPFNLHVMPRSKKTINVDLVLEFANSQLKRTDEDANAEFKSGIITMIEKILHETGNYHGFLYLDSTDCEFGTLGWYNRRYLK